MRIMHAQAQLGIDPAIGHDILEQRATAEQKRRKIDLVDFLFAPQGG